MKPQSSGPRGRAPNKFGLGLAADFTAITCLHLIGRRQAAQVCHLPGATGILYRCAGEQELWDAMRDLIPRGSPFPGPRDVVKPHQVNVVPFAVLCDFE
jgi:hypothetical protein